MVSWAFLRGLLKGFGGRTAERFGDSECCPLTFAEFSLKEFERDREGNWIDEIPDGNDHSIDAVRYAMMDDALRGVRWGGTFHNFTFDIFDIFTMNSERNWDMSSVGERDSWVPVHVREYLTSLGYRLPLEAMEEHIRAWHEWMEASGAFYDYRDSDGFGRVYEVHRRSIHSAMRVCREWGSFFSTTRRR